MKNLPCLMIVSLFLLTPFVSSFAQDRYSNYKTGEWNELYQSVKNEYGFDQLLVNGVCFEDYYQGSIGHPFLFEDQFVKGSMEFRGRTYKGLDLKYDIYKQQVVVFVTQDNSNIWIMPPKEFISSFSLGDHLFKEYTFQGISRFYQVIIDSENLKCLYYWSKIRYDSDHQKIYNSSRFTDGERKSYLLIGKSLEKYNDNQSFVNLFPREHQLQIKQYLKSNKIKVNNSSDFEMAKLLSFCETLL